MKFNPESGQVLLNLSENSNETFLHKIQNNHIEIKHQFLPKLILGISWSFFFVFLK